MRRNTYPNTHSNGYTYANTHSNGYTYADTHSNRHTYTNSHSHYDSNSYAYSASNSDAKDYSIAKTSPDTASATLTPLEVICVPRAERSRHAIRCWIPGSFGYWVGALPKPAMGITKGI